MTEDPSIRLAVEALSGRVPALGRLRRGRHFITQRDDVTVTMKLTKNGMSVVDSRQPDGSVVKGPSRAIADVETTIRRRGADQDELRRARERVEAAPIGTRTQIAPGLAVKHNRSGSICPDLRRPFAAEESFLAIAFLYIALNIGTAIYSPGFDAVRRALRDRGDGGWSVTPMFGAGSYEPFHALALESWRSGLSVQIRLLGCLVWMVTIDGLALPRDFAPAWYRLGLDSGEESVVRGHLRAAV